MPDPSRLAIVVVAWRSDATLPALLRSVERHLGDAPQVVLVANDEGEASGRGAPAYAGELRLVEPGRTLGFGAASNAGVAAAERPAVALLNPDCELTDPGLAALAKVAERERALVGPRLVNPDGSRQPSASGPPTGPWPWVGALVPGALQPRVVRARTEPWRLDRQAEVAWLTGACVVAPREALAELGPFDPRIDLYAEDMDLGLRARRAGVRSIFRPDLCRVVHLGGASTSQAFDEEETARRIARNRRAVVLRHAGSRAEARSWHALRLRLALRCAAKAALRMDATRDRRELEATRAASRPAPLGSGAED